MKKILKIKWHFNMKCHIILLLPLLLVACNDNECYTIQGPPEVYTYVCTGNAHVVTVQSKEIKK